MCYYYCPLSALTDDCQGFIKAIVQPLYKSLAKVPGVNFNNALDCLDTNIKKWEATSAT